MAKVVDRPGGSALYQNDVYRWTEQQAELLRKGRLEDLDVANLAEEIEDLGANLRNTVFSRTEQIIRHLLKLEYSMADEPRRLWRRSVRDQRDELDLRLTGTLRNLLEDTLPTRYARARRRANEDLAEHKEQVNLPAACPYSLDEILAHDWFPERE